MNIVLVSADFPPNVGGVAAHVAELGRALSIMGHRVDVITRPADGSPNQGQWQGMTIHRPALARLKPLFTVQLRKFLRAYVHSQQPDVVHVHGLRPLEATIGMDTPVVFTNHTSGFLQRVERGARAQRRIGRRLSHLRQVMAPSQELVDATRAVGYRGPVEFIPNGVDVERFQPLSNSNTRAQLGLRENDVVVLLARRLVPKNGVAYFAQSAQWFRAPHVRIVVAGDGPEKAGMQAALSKVGMLEQTNFLGAVENSRMPALYQCADISVLPSLQEATSITGLESMACGLPLVGTAVGGIPVLIEPDKTGLLVPARNAQAFGEAVHTLVGSATLRASMGRAARARVEAMFSWEHVAQATCAIYEQVCE
jgi:glycosyltransferase involved in cell wall biosynthesis